MARGLVKNLSTEGSIIRRISEGGLMTKASKWDQNYTEINWKKKKEFIKKYRTILDKGDLILKLKNYLRKTS